jgi:hypothetical protein
VVRRNPRAERNHKRWPFPPRGQGPRDRAKSRSPDTPQLELVEEAAIVFRPLSHDDSPSTKKGKYCIMSRLVFALTLLAMGNMAAIPAAAGLLTIDANSNIFGAGHSVAPAPGGGSGGTLPPVFSFTAGSGSFVTVTDVTGTISLTPGVSNGADGSAAHSTNISSVGGISGIIDTNRFAFLVGVFLGSSSPTNTAPPILTFSSPENFTSLSPQLGQTFFIGDGLTATGGITQEFIVPAGASRLFLGFADANGIQGAPGEYQDNSGSLQADVTISGVPEPASLVMLGTAALCALGWSRIHVGGKTGTWRRGE